MGGHGWPTYISGNVFAVPEPRMRLREGHMPEAGHGRVMRSWCRPSSYLCRCVVVIAIGQVNDLKSHIAVKQLSSIVIKPGV